MVKMIIDCDPGHDDAIALILAHTLAEVMGITTVSGNAPIESTTANALGVCALLDTNTPVYRGSAQPLQVAPVHASQVHGKTGLGSVQLPEHSLSVEAESAVEYLLDAPDKDTWVVPIGPLTNIARVLQKNPAWSKQIAGLSIMGGSTAKGNVTSVAEFNIYHDPEAAQIVFASGAFIKMLGLNVTTKVTTDDSSIQELRSALKPEGENKIAEFSIACLENIHEALRLLRGVSKAAMHDPCAVLALTHPEIFEFLPRQVEIETQGEFTRGMTVVDERGWSKEAVNAQVGYEVDSVRALELVLSVLKGTR